MWVVKTRYFWDIYVPLIDVKPFVKFGIDTLQKNKQLGCVVYTPSHVNKNITFKYLTEAYQYVCQPRSIGQWSTEDTAFVLYRLYPQTCFMLCCITSNLVATVDWPLGMCIYCLLDNRHCWWNPPLLDDSKSWAIQFKDTQFITITYPRNWMAFYRRYVQVDWYSTIEHIAIWSNLPRNGWNMLKWNQNRKHQKTILTYIKPNIKPYKTVLNMFKPY